MTPSLARVSTGENVGGCEVVGMIWLLAAYLSPAVLSAVWGSKNAGLGEKRSEFSPRRQDTMPERELGRWNIDDGDKRRISSGER